MRSFLIALAFLTVLPIRFREMPEAAAIARSRFWYPVAGLLLGVLLAGWTCAAAHLAPPAIAAFLVLLVWIVITGALHLDGFCDLCDGLFGGWTPDDRLRIMKDPQRGTFAIAGCVLLLLGKFVALHELMHKRFDLAAPWSVGMAVLLSRSMVLWVAAGARYPREEGTGRVIVEATRVGEALLFAVLAAGSVAALPIGELFAKQSPDAIHAAHVAMAVDHAALLILALSVPTWLTMMLVRWMCQYRLGGITGDCLGAAIELAELVFLMIAAVTFR
jgi:adenosylcobinamide-GDP ribazoletransferase